MNRKLVSVLTGLMLAASSLVLSAPQSQAASCPAISGYKVVHTQLLWKEHVAKALPGSRVCLLKKTGSTSPAIYKVAVVHDSSITTTTQVLRYKNFKLAEKIKVTKKFTRYTFGPYSTPNTRGSYYDLSVVTSTGYGATFAWGYSGVDKD